MNRPDAMILAYPVITMKEYTHIGSRENLLGKNPDPSLLEEMSLETQVSSLTPPTFLWHTFEDTSVPVENSLMFAQAHRENKVPFELHIYPKGSHGLSLANNETDTGKMGTNRHVSGWVQLCMDWLEETFQQGAAIQASVH
jgi:dipeptidyl aminopeptidase/acylaminoacyl peptidase